MSKRFENHLGYWCHRAAFAFRSSFEARSRKLGLHYGEAVVLIRIRMDGPQSLAELSRNLGHSHPTVLAQVTSLEYSGLLQRAQHPEDRRIRIISLTEKGEKIAVSLEHIADEIQESVSSRFGKKDSAELIHILKKLTQTISQSEPTPESSRRSEHAIPTLIPVKS